ncbi:hypothetical protein V2J09_000204 [Rumex salicifolius]
MDEPGSGRVTGIRQIVRLKELLNRWHSAALISKRNNNNNNNNNNDNSPHHTAIRFKALSSMDSEEEGCGTLQPPPDVPKGYLAVYVGPEHRRFIIPTTYLRHNLFKILLEKVEEEYGFDHAGALTIPCETETFKYLLKCIETHPEDPESCGEC